MKKSSNKNFWILALRIFICYLITCAFCFVAFVINSLFDNGFKDYIVVMIVFGATACVLLSTVVVAGRQKSEKKFLNEVKTVIDKAFNGDLTARLSMTKNQSLDEIADGINSLISELDSVDALKNDFTSKFLHTFVLPIENLNAHAAKLVAAANVDERKAICSEIYAESGRIAEMVDKEMFLSKIENRHLLEKTTFNINEQIEKCAVAFYKEVDKKSIGVDIKLPPIAVAANRSQTEELWNTLFKSAIESAARGDSISVSSDGEKIVFSFDKIECSDLSLRIINRVAEINFKTLKIRKDKNNKSVFEFYL